MFWKPCNNPKQLFSNKNLRSSLLHLDIVTEKKLSFKAEIITFEIQLLDVISVQGIAMHVEEFQFQYYLRSNLSIQLYGNYKSSYQRYGDTDRQSDNRNSVLLFEQRLMTQHLVRDNGKIIMLLFLSQNKEKFSSLSFKLRSMSTILHQIISIEVLEPKTYKRNTIIW